MSVSDTRISQLLREYDEVRSAAEASARDRKQLIYARIPRIMEIDQELDAFGLRAVQTYLRSGKNKDLVLNSLKETNQRLKADLQSCYPFLVILFQSLLNCLLKLMLLIHRLQLLFHLSIFFPNHKTNDLLLKIHAQ